MVRTVTGSIALLAMAMMMSGMIGCESQPKGPKAEGDLPKLGPTSDTTGSESIYWRVPDEKREQPVAYTEAPPPPPPAPAPAGTVSASVPFPTGVTPGSGLLVTKTAPAEVVVNQPFDYQITARNLTAYTLYDVKVTDKMPGSFKVISSDPSGSISSGMGTWNLGELAPKQSVTISIKGQASEPGELVNCAMGSYSLMACVTTQVIEPKIKITKSGPKEVLKCDPIQYAITVTNTGTGNATNVQVTDTLPDGLMTTDNRQSVTVNIGSLAAGQSRNITINAKANKTGNFTNSAVATADGNLKAEAKVTTKVTQPVLAITKAAPAKAFVGNTIKYDMTVTNKGDGVAKNLMVSDAVPAGTTFVSADSGGTLDGGSVVWRFGNLEPGQTKSFSMQVKTNAKGEVKNTVAASADCAESVTAADSTSVEGIPAILLEVVDEEDPVAVGSNTTYLITVTNQGSATGRNIKIVATLDDSQSYVGADGATGHQTQGRTVTFEALPELAPKAKASWRVTVKADKADDARFSVQMTEDQLTRPVNETEATNLYEGG